MDMLRAAAAFFFLSVPQCGRPAILPNPADSLGRRESWPEVGCDVQLTSGSSSPPGGGQGDLGRALVFKSTSPWAK